MCFDGGAKAKEIYERKVGIVGLGLIGGSLAKAYRAAGTGTVLGFDTDETIRSYAQMSGVIDGTLTKEALSDCDLILICTPPRAVLSFLRKYASNIGAKPLVMDCAGTKQNICHDAFALAERYGFTFIGGHPMAGSHNSGFKYSRADLFFGAPMVLVPPRYDDIHLFERARTLLSPAGFGSYSVCTPEQHDARIAFTSQLAHVVSNAYMQNPTAKDHKGFSAGSYQDLTRVAWLDADMWSDLFIENSENLSGELDDLILTLQTFRRAIYTHDRATLHALLEYGKQCKGEVDGKC